MYDHEDSFSKAYARQICLQQHQYPIFVAYINIGTGTAKVAMIPNDIISEKIKYIVCTMSFIMQMFIEWTSCSLGLKLSYRVQLAFVFLVLNIYVMKVYMGYKLTIYITKSTNSMKKYNPSDPSPSLFICFDGSKSLRIAALLFRASLPNPI